MELTSETFEKEIFSGEKLKIVDFWASWCMPCKMLSPVVEEMAEKHPEVDFYKINVDEEVSVAFEYNISSIPALLFFKNGELIHTSVGYSDAAELEEMIGEYK